MTETKTDVVQDIVDAIRKHCPVDGRTAHIVDALYSWESYVPAKYNAEYNDAGEVTSASLELFDYKVLQFDGKEVQVDSLRLWLYESF